MEFSGIGKHCTLPQCNKRDFLPFSCDFCNCTYCNDHWTRDKHNCIQGDPTETTNVMPSCPVCNRFVFVPAGQSADQRVNLHINSQCKLYLLETTEAAVRQRQHERLRCDHAGCKNKNNYETVRCKHCHQQYCLTHRTIDAHDCANKQAANRSHHAQGGGMLSKGQALLDKLKSKRDDSAASSTASSGLTGIYSSKAKPAAKKQQLSLAQIRSRMRAEGDDKLAERERFYIDLSLPTTTIDGQSVREQTSRMAFTNKHWSAARLLEDLAQRYDLPNHNNDIKYRRLVIYSDRTKAELPMDIPLELLEPMVSSGDSLRLQYVKRE